MATKTKSTTSTSNAPLQGRKRRAVKVASLPKAKRVEMARLGQTSKIRAAMAAREQRQKLERIRLAHLGQTPKIAMAAREQRQKLDDEGAQYKALILRDWAAFQSFGIARLQGIFTRGVYPAPLSRICRLRGWDLRRVVKSRLEALAKKGIAGHFVAPWPA